MIHHSLLMKGVIIMNKTYKYIIMFISILFLVGCNNTMHNEEKHLIISIKKGEDVVIDSNEIRESATYYNYETNGTIIQLFAVKATDGSVRVLFNTCASCNPSPSAYFIQAGDYFICQNCGNKFHRDEIGLTKTYGCSPIAVLDENKKIDGNFITIAHDFIESYQPNFEKINIYKN